MKFIEYENKYLDEVRDLLVELEEHILLIDEDKLDQLHPEYREKMALVDLNNVKSQNGKCLLAIEDAKVVGLVMGTIPEYEKYDYLDYKCPKRGIVTELVVSKSIRGKGIGRKLLKKIEEYFKSQNCEYVLIDVFAYNDGAINFYNKNGYHARMITDIKKI